MQNARKYFFVFKKIHAKTHFLLNFEYLFFLRGNSKYVRVLDVCMKTFIYIYVCMLATLRRKLGILNTRFVFLQYKNTKTTK